MKTYTLVTLALVLLSFRSPMQAQWVQTKGPYGGSVVLLGISGPNLLAGSKGLFYSSDNGASWAKSDFPPFGPSTLLNTSGGTLAGFIGNLGPTVGGGVARSTDHGVHWNSPVSTLSDPFINCLAATNIFIFAATSYSMYRSTDDGTSWTTTANGLPAPPMNAYSLCTFDSVLLTGTYEGVFRSLNNGETWESDAMGLRDSIVWTFGLGQDEGRTASVYAATTTHVFRSSHQRPDWVPADSGLPHTRVHSFAASGTLLYAATDSGLYVRGTSGGMWKSASDGLPTSKVYTVVVAGDSIFVGTERGVFVSNDTGATWQEVNHGMTNASITVFAANDTTLFAVSYPNGLFKTSDNGERWEPSTRGIACSHITALLMQEGYLFAGTERGLFHSTDLGATWTKSSIGISDSVVWALSSSGGDLFAVTDNCIYRSANKGESWEKAGAFSKSRTLTSMLGDGTRLFATTSDSGIFVSIDKGASWSHADSGIPHYTPVLALGSMRAHSTTEGCILFAGTNGGGVFRSRDNGQTWTHPGSLGRYFDQFVRSIKVVGRSVFVGTEAGTLVSSDEGDSWTDIQDGLNYGVVGALAESGGYLFAGSAGDGVWRRPLTEVISSVSQVRSELPNEFSLQQNYPNPFNPSATVRYELPKASMVRLSVYDILGREVAVLVDEMKNAGTYVVRFDGSNLASGVYFYRIQAGGFTKARRLLLLK
jgi:photosystem II stability/assembly factor-like uncharacterized protein